MSKQNHISRSMIRCIKTTNLEVHYKRTDGGNDIENAVVLCQQCYANNNGNTMHEKTATSFPQSIKNMAFERANRRCECTSDIRSCH
ncbi:MAG: hypothetical protein PHS84_11090 [Paludibacter sp.]|jgi:hypothetical protein|nr:hypothetical protein [Paludibacter sp.]